MSNEIYHYGTPRHSGRYPWGSGKDPYQSGGDFLAGVAELRKQGFSETQIAAKLQITTSQLRNFKTIATEQVRAEKVSTATKLRNKGMSNTAIGVQMGINESSVRSLLNKDTETRANITSATANILKQRVKEKTFVDVGLGTEYQMNIARTKLKAALEQLKNEGYTIHYINVEQLGTKDKKTSVMVLAPPDTPYMDVVNNRHKIALVQDYTIDGGRSYLGLEPVQSISSKKVLIRYAEEGGSDKDGVLELRRNVDKLSLGNSQYAQVRVGVDNKSYIKGMALYGDNIPDGYDIVFNTNKPKGTPMEKVLKDMKTLPNGKVDQDNPFGASISRQNGHLNIVAEEGYWGDWSKSISSQVLSKQNPTLVKNQLGLSLESRKEELASIQKLTNPVIRRKMLESFADSSDSAATDLKAAALPRQASFVILPFPKMKPTEIYAPQYRDGEKVVLIRYPHGGTFEIPELTVNNKYGPAKKIISNARDAVGIHPDVAQKLSGADFDGDAVLVIPNNNKKITHTSSLKGLEKFDPQVSYPPVKGMKTMKNKQNEMGKISNLITDMTIKGAPPNDIAAAVRHSMVVIDAEKHNLNYKLSEVDNRIASLKEKYQGAKNAGASTLISRAGSEQRVNARQEIGVDPKTGVKIYRDKNESYINKDGKEVFRTQSTTRMAEVKDAKTLSSGTVIENMYASHANELKELANTARKDAIKVKNKPYSPEARKIYAAEVETLTSKLNIVKRNKPVERQAQILANQTVSEKRKSYPDMDPSELKRLKEQSLSAARFKTGTIGRKKREIIVTPREWEAIQQGALFSSMQKDIFDSMNSKALKELATPREDRGITPSQIAKIKSMLNAGYTQAEVADALHVSTSTVNKVS